MSSPAEIAAQTSHALQGSASFAFGQFSAFERMRAIDVLPTPRLPVNRKAFATRPSRERVLERRRDVLLPDDVAERLRAVLQCEGLVAGGSWGSPKTAARRKALPGHADRGTWQARVKAAPVKA